jgi:hypothetical protein
VNRDLPITKTQRLRDLIAAGDWARALSLANTFRHLGPHRDTIRLAHECRVHPRYYCGLGRDPEAATAAGIAALRQLYPTNPTTGATNMPATTKAARAPKYRTFTLARIEEASDLQCGFCLACGAMRENCEPDARKYRCDDCRQNQVYGAEEIVLMGLMR